MIAEIPISQPSKIAGSANLISVATIITTYTMTAYVAIILQSLKTTATNARHFAVSQTVKLHTLAISLSR
jgi:hypothetical protein